MTTISQLIGNSIIKLGDQGAHVRAVQLAMIAIGAKLKGTGYFGAATNTAVTEFQKQHDLVADGVVGRDTATALDFAAKPTITGNIIQLPAESQRPLWVISAIKWIGTREQPGSKDNPIILNWAKGMGGDIAKEYTHDSIPWCALFAGEVLWENGLKGTGTLWALDYAKWGVALTGPAVGAFAPMKRNGGGHIPIVVGRDQHNNLMCVGGNQSDSVNIKPFDPDRVVAYRWPVGVSLPDKVGMNNLPIVQSDGKLSSNEG